MIKILFVCLGNICRSPMAEFILKEMVRQRNLENDFFIESAATSSEEVGNEMHIGTRKKLNEKGISYTYRVARKLSKLDYDKYDYIIGMDKNNIWNMERIFGQDKANKIFRLLEFSDNVRDIADPWYTGNFEQTYNDVVEGCNGLLEYVLKENR